MNAEAEFDVIITCETIMIRNKNVYKLVNNRIAYRLIKTKTCSFSKISAVRLTAVLSNKDENH